MAFGGRPGTSWRRWTGIEPAGRGSPVPTALKAAEPTRCSDTSAHDATQKPTGWRRRARTRWSDRRCGAPAASVLSPHRLPPCIHPRPPADWGNVMVTLCWAAKGGSGTTVVAASLALNSSHPSLLVDLDGELPAALGLPEPDRPGVADWLASDAVADQLADLMIDVAPHRWLLPWRSGTSGAIRPGRPGDGDRWHDIGRWLHGWADRWGCEITIDGGTGDPPPALVEHADRVLLVTRPCYLSLRRAVRGPTRPTGVVLVDEPGRALSRRDVEHAVGAPVEATVSIDPAVARAVDAGLLATRLPRPIARELRRVAA